MGFFAVGISRPLRAYWKRGCLQTDEILNEDDRKCGCIDADAAAGVRAVRPAQGNPKPFDLMVKCGLMEPRGGCSVDCGANEVTEASSNPFPDGVANR